jgi:hypothetical protein
MAQAFKQRYKVDPSKVYQVVGACTAAVGVLIKLFFYEHETATPCEVCGLVHKKRQRGGEHEPATRGSTKPRPGDDVLSSKEGHSDVEDEI